MGRFRLVICELSDNFSIRSEIFLSIAFRICHIDRGLGYEYDVFISYRHKDNKYDGWAVTAASIRAE